MPIDFSDLIPKGKKEATSIPEGEKEPVQGVLSFDDLIPKNASKTSTITPTTQVLSSGGLSFDDLIPKEGKTIISSEKKKKFETNFMAWMDRLDRPARAVWTSIEEINKQEPTFEKGPLGLPDFSKPIPSEKPFSLRERIKATLRGLTGEEKRTSSEIINKMGEEAGIPKIPGLGLGVNIATDPLTYLGAPIFKVIGKGLGATGKLAQKVPLIAETTEKIGEAAKPVVTAFQKAFRTSTGIPQLDELVSKYGLEKEFLKGQAFKYGVKVRNVLQNIVKKTGRSIDDVSKEVVNLIELPEKTVATLPETQALANTLKTHFSNLLTTEMKAGVPITALSETKRGIQYFPRITTQEARQYLSQAKIGNSRIWNPKIANALRRKTGDFTLDEFNLFAKEHGLESLGGRSVEQFFMKNPSYAVAIRGIGSAKGVTSAQFIQDAGKIFGKEATLAPPTWQELPETLQKLYPALKGKKFDPEVLGEITQAYEKVFNPKEVGGFLKLYDNVQNYWKAWTLSPFPKYHIRNMVGNLWNNYLAGVVNPKSYAEAGALQNYRKTGNESILKAAGLTKQQADDIILKSEKLGVVGQGWFGADIPSSIEQEVGKANKNLLSVKGHIIEKGRAVGTTVENNARLAHFVDKLGKGATPEDAAISVKKFLFDYSDLTTFEKQVMKRMFPFYTWTRKNIPLQAEQLWKQPQKFIPIEKALVGRDRSDLEKLGAVKPWLQERLPVELKRTDKTVTYLPLEGLLPAADLSKVVRPQEIAVELLSPYIRTPIELGINKSFFTEQEIQKYPEETQEFLRLDIPVKWKYALTSVFPQARMLSSLNTIIKKKEKSEPLTLDEQAVEHTLSKVYKENLDDLSLKAMQKIQIKVNDLKRAHRWAIRKGRDKEADRISETIKKTIEEMDKF